MANKIESIEVKRELLSSEFHQYYFITLNKTLNTPTNQFVNVTIPFEKILDTNDDYGLSHLLSYFNKDFSNILITHADNFNVIHKVECYKNVLFIRLQPYTTKIALHILPKIYDTTDDILFLKGTKANCTETNITSFYNTHDDDTINLYFQESSETDRDKNHKPYPEFDKFDETPKLYHNYNENSNNWVSSNYQNTYGEFNFNIQNRKANNMQNVQINVGYKYNDSSPTNAVHYTGTKDITNANAIDRCTLIDTNFDNITEESNVIEQFELDNNQNVIFPTTASPTNNGFTHDSGLHSANIGKLYHKTIKYFNDEMYSEEFDGSETKFMNSEWIDLSNES